MAEFLFAKHKKLKNNNQQFAAVRMRLYIKDTIRIHLPIFSSIINPLNYY